MFVVTGITGKVGAAVARSLLSADQPVRAVIRDRGRGAPWAHLGCDIAVADLSDTDSLTAAFAGAAGVFAMLPPVFDPAPGYPEAMGFIDPLRAALARAKPAKVVALSTIGADAPQPNLLNILGRMEDALGSLRMPVAFLRAAWFMENAAWDIDSAKSGLIQSYLPAARPCCADGRDRRRSRRRRAAARALGGQACSRARRPAARLAECSGRSIRQSVGDPGACGGRAVRTVGIELPWPRHEESHPPQTKELGI